MTQPDPAATAAARPGPAPAPCPGRCAGRPGARRAGSCPVPGPATAIAVCVRRSGAAGGPAGAVTEWLNQLHDQNGIAQTGQAVTVWTAGGKIFLVSRERNRNLDIVRLLLVIAVNKSTFVPMLFFLSKRRQTLT